MSDVIPCPNPEGCNWPACSLDCQWRPGQVRYHPDLLEATVNKLVENSAKENQQFHDRICDMHHRNAKLVAVLTEVYELAAGCNEISLDSPQMRRARKALANQ